MLHATLTRGMARSSAKLWIQTQVSLVLTRFWLYECLVVLAEVAWLPIFLLTFVTRCHHAPSKAFVALGPFQADIQ